MRKSTRALLVISTFLLIVGCGSVAIKGDTKSPLFSVFNPYFKDAAKDYVYRTKIIVYGNELNGILIAKKINDSVHRVVFTTDFGNTLIDIEVGQKSFQMNSIVDDLDRKIVVNTLRDDFRLLFRERFDCSGADLADDQKMTYECIEGSSHYRIVFTDKKLESVTQGSAKKDKLKLSFHSENDIFADRIEIRHFNIKLSIEMNHFAQ